MEVVARLGKSVLGDSPLDWNQLNETGRIRTAIARVIPGWEKIEQIEKTKEEFQIRGRTLHKPIFPTESGRARLHAYDIPELKGTGNELRLMTVRSEGQFNTVVYEEYDLYRGQERRDVLLVHSDDVQRLGLQHDQLVRIESSVGVMEGFRIRSFDKIRPGNALMYYPEANVLVPRTADPSSKTPAFKGIIIRVTAA